MLLKYFELLWPPRSRAKSIGKDPNFDIINNYLCKYKYMYIEDIPFYVYIFSFLYHLVGPDLISDTTGKIRNLVNPSEHLGSSLVSINLFFGFFSSFLWCIFFFVRLRSVCCTHCCLCLCIIHSSVFFLRWVTTLYFTSDFYSYYLI